ncbi:cyclic lactone autoinducer peptide [Paenibacillus sp. sptzw28]|nr:cyclic lactone autoinducer peptide [Paenibacillus sp. sptzw28]QYR22678.1 cyclic lactone autoinducer peptide [Paenibacillus sp. sptzw28]
MKIKQLFVMVVSGALFLVAFSSVCVASPWWSHRPTAPEGLLKKR